MASSLSGQSKKDMFDVQTASFSTNKEELIDEYSSLQDLFGGTWKGSLVWNREFEALLTAKDLLNGKQCAKLFEAIKHVTKVVDHLLKHNNEGLDFSSLRGELFMILMESYLLIQSCGKSKWCEETICHLNSIETFRQLFVDIKYWCNVANNFLAQEYPHDSQYNCISSFDIATQDEVDNDVEHLQENLNNANDKEDHESQILAKYLLKRLNIKKHIDLGKDDALKLLLETSRIEVIIERKIGSGHIGEIYEAKWLGFRCALKKMKDGYEKIFYEKVNNLVKLSHPNLIPYYFARQEKVDENIELYIGMELMDSNLKFTIENKKNSSFLFFLDILLQVAKGMCYLHDMHIAHCNLKLENILLNVKEIKVVEKIFQFVKVKLIDFGISKVGIGNYPRIIENVDQSYDNVAFIAPEMLKAEFQGIEVSPFEADVYSFAMVCANIFSKDDPFFSCCNLKEMLKKIEEGERPNLSSSNRGLNNLIEKCWNLDHQQRPKFLEICEELKKLKQEFVLASMKENTTFEVSKKVGYDKEEIQHFFEETYLDNKQKEENLGAKNVDKDENNSHYNMWSIFRANFEDLEVEEKDMFLDICCFFANDVCQEDMSKERALRLWMDREKNISEKKVEMMLDTLICRTLVEINRDGMIRVHDQLQEMGRDIIKSKEMYKNTRIWNLNAVELDQISNKLKGIFYHYTEKSICQTKEALFLSLDFLYCNFDNCAPNIFIQILSTFIVLGKNSPNLKCFLLDMSNLQESKEKFGKKIIKKALHFLYAEDMWKNFKNLNVLQLRHFFFIKKIPKSLFKIITLLELDLQGCSNLLEIPNDIRYMILLKKINLADCKNLKSLPNDVSNLLSLTTLNLRQCSSLTSLPNKLGNLTSLTTLDIGQCYNLISLPNEIGNLTSLTTLDLRQCSSLTSLPNELGNLIFLITLNIKGCTNLTSLPNELGNLTSLTTLDIGQCCNLISLPNELGNLTSLTTLDIKQCSNLVLLPNKLDNITSLITLNLEGCASLTSLPNEVGNFTSLITLNLEGCISLTSLPNEVGNFTSLITLYIGRCSGLTFLPNELGNLTSLTTLEMWNCSRLTSLPKELGNLTSLIFLNIGQCSSLTFLPNELGNLTSLTKLEMWDCSRLTSLPNKLGNLTSLMSLNIKQCSSLKTLPNELSNLTSLIILNLEQCSSLISLPNKLGNLISLTTLNIRGCSSLTLLPNELGNLTSLKTLEMSDCSSLKSIPHEIGNLTSFTTLDIGGCSKLTSLPNKLGNLKGLTILSLRGCSRLTSLPKELGNLTSLAHFVLRGCSRLTSLPKELGNLTSLNTIDLDRCSKLASLPKELGNLTSLENLHLEGCSSLTSLPNELGNLPFLRSLYLKECTSLTLLPSEFGNLKNLTGLYLNWCSKLALLPNELINVTSLTTLNLYKCSNLKSLPDKLDNLTSLRALDLGGCSSLMLLPNEVGKLKALDILHLGWCLSLTSLPNELGNLTSLTTLDINSCSSLISLPSELGNLTSLISLFLEGCSRLTSLPKELGNLTSLTILNLEWCSSLTSLPNELGNLTSLTKLCIRGCSSLTSLPNELGNLTSLLNLNLEGCSNLISLLNELDYLKSLYALNMWGCSRLTSLLDEILNLLSFPTVNLGLLYIAKNLKLLKALKKKILKIGNITSITSLDTQSLLYKNKINILCCFNKIDKVFEFYFEDYRSMGEIVSIGLDYAKVTLDGGWQIKAFQITEEEWKNTWQNFESIPSTLLLTLYEPQLDPNIEDDLKSKNEISQLERHVLWDIAKYFVLDSAITSLISEIEILSSDFVNMLDGAKTKSHCSNEASSSSSSNPKPSSNKSPGVLLDAVQKLFSMGISKLFLENDGEDPPPPNSSSPDIQEEMTVFLYLLPGGDPKGHHQSIRPELLSQLNRSIHPEFRFTFKKGNGDAGTGTEVEVIVGPIKFEFDPKNRQNYSKFQSFGWYHNNLKVQFYPTHEQYAHLSKGEILDADISQDAQSSSTSNTRINDTQNSITGKLGFSSVVIAEVGGNLTSSKSNALCTTNETVSVKSSTKTKNGFFIVKHLYTGTGCLECLCYEDPTSPSTTQYEKLSDSNYLNLIYAQPCWETQTVTYRGTWIPDGPEEMVEYNFKASRKMSFKRWNATDSNISKGLRGLIVPKKRNAGPQEETEDVRQKLVKKLYVNHAMPQLKKTIYYVRERASPNIDGKYLTKHQSMDPPEWNIPLLDVKP